MLALPLTPSSAVHLTVVCVVCVCVACVACVCVCVRLTVCLYRSGWYVCLLGGTDVCGALEHILLPHFHLLHSDLVLRQQYHPPTEHTLIVERLDGGIGERFDGGIDERCDGGIGERFDVRIGKRVDGGHPPTHAHPLT